MEHIRSLIREVPDFPAPGILFRDITPLLADGAAFRDVIGLLADRARPLAPDLIAGIEARGFIFAAPLAAALGVGFVPVRKIGKLPARIIHREYALEYGANRLELHSDAVQPGQRVLLVDDLLATGGTALAAAEMVRELGGDLVGISFVLELTQLGGRERLFENEVSALVSY